MEKYEYVSSDYMITNIGEVMDWDNTIQNYIIKNFSINNYMNDEVLTFVPKKYFHQVLYWAWKNGVIDFDSVNKYISEFSVGGYTFIKVDSVMKPDFDAKKVLDAEDLKVESEVFQIAVRWNTKVKELDSSNPEVEIK